MKVNYYTKTGSSKQSKYDLSDEVFASDINDQLLTQYVYIYNSNQRQSNAHTKTRGEISGGGKKPWRQKGTGRARHGSSRSPIWTGGGVTFGPRNTRNFKKKITKKMKLTATKSAFSYLASDKRVSVIENLEVTKTKELNELVSKLGMDKKVTILVDKNDSLLRSSKNLDNVDVKTTNDLSIFDILNSGNLVIEESAIDQINSKWSNEVINEEKSNVSEKKSSKVQNQKEKKKVTKSRKKANSNNKANIKK